MYATGTDLYGTVTSNKTSSIVGEKVALIVIPNEGLILKEIPKTITIREMENGTVTSNKTSSIVGETVTLTVTPNEGYKLKEIRILDMYDEMLVTLNEDNTFTMPSYNVFISAEFELIPKTITIREMENGTVTSNKTSSIVGETVTLTVTPNEGYKLKEIRILDMYDEMLVTLNEDNTFTMPSYNVFISADFELIYSEKTITKTEGSSTFSIKGTLSGNPELVITKTEKGNEGYNSLITLVKEDKEVIGSYDVSVIGGDYEGELELTSTITQALS